MTQDEIIEMAKQAWISDKEAQLITEFDEAYLSCTYLTDLTAFANLVAQHEREACAKVCETYDQRESFNDEDMAVADSCAEAIRARGQA
jgi:hypothetical protein